MNRRNRVTRLEAIPSDPSTGCCCTSREIFEQYIAHGVCYRTGTPLCTYQCGLAASAAERVAQVQASLSRA